MYMCVLHDRYLMVPSKDYRVVVVEPLLCPSHFRNTLARALFNHFSVRINV
jgi:actin-related protein 10